MTLSEMLDRVHLPEVIARECGPDAIRGLHYDRGGVICDPRPAQRESHPSFSVYRNESGRWKWKRHGGDEAGGDALTFLESIGYRPEHAREELSRHAGVILGEWTLRLDRPSYVVADPLREAQRVLKRCAPLDEQELSCVYRLLSPLQDQDRASLDLQRRGLLDWAGLEAGKLRRDFSTRDGRLLAHAGALAFLLTGPDGQIWGLKVRNLGTADELRTSGLDRYVYRIARHGAPAWCSPDYGQGAEVLLVEGELNGAAASLALRTVGRHLDVQGLAGAGGTPFLHGLHGKPVYLYADPDTAGQACIQRLGRLIQAAGAREVRVVAGLSEGDFSDLCGTLGAFTFGKALMVRLQAADYWQVMSTGKQGMPANNLALSEEKRLLANWQTPSGWGGNDASGWGTRAGGWDSDDRGGW